LPAPTAASVYQPDDGLLIALGQRGDHLEKPGGKPESREESRKAGTVTPSSTQLAMPRSIMSMLFRTAFC
jgi:hypothetical protein